MEALWQGLLAIYLVAGLWLSWWTIVQVREKRTDPFFGIFFVSALIYLQIAPTLSSLFGYQTVILGSTTPSTGDYALVQTSVWLLFLGPLLFFYTVPLASRPRRETTMTRIVPSASWPLACFSGVALSALYLYELFSRNILFQRIGTEGAASRVVSLPATAFAIVRLFDNSAYFLAAVLILLRTRARTHQQRLCATIALASVTVAFMIPAGVNSRLGSATFILNLAAWHTVFSARRLTIGRSTRRGLLILLAMFLMAEVALNARHIFPPLISGSKVPAPAFYSPVGKGEGIARLDCVDLIARTERPIFDQGPAWGAAWQAVPWLVRRYVDPAGFDAFRATGRTTAKTYMLQRYLSDSSLDYNSCSLTDQFGNFWFAGFLFGGVFFGLAFQLIRRRLAAFDTSKPRSLLIAMFFGCAWLRFEQETSSLLFGWMSFLPLLIVFSVFPPIRRSRTDTGAEESTPRAKTLPLAAKSAARL